MQLSDAHLQMRAQARRFADEVIRPLAAELDRTKRFPAEIVSDGPRGIGRGIAFPPAAAESDRVIDDLVRDAGADARLAGIAERDAGASLVATAIVDPAAHPRLVDAAFAAFGRLDCLVDNAGVSALSRGDLLDVLP